MHVKYTQYAITVELFTYMQKKVQKASAVTAAPEEEEEESRALASTCAIAARLYWNGIYVYTLKYS